jgi:hypothetical protein
MADEQAKPENDGGAEVNRLAHSFSPTIITAPTARNGITLIQRLLNSTRQAMVFGENIHFFDWLPRIAMQSYLAHARLQDEFEQSREKFLHETTEYWSSNLFPDSGNCTAIAFEAFYKYATNYQQTAHHCGFRHWGMKNPMPEPDTIRTLSQLLRPARFVFMYRNPFDVVASAKARRFVTNTQQAAAYARQWRQHLQAIHDQPPTHLLMMQYESLVSDPEPLLQELETFTGLTGIDRSVLDRKINTFAASDTEGQSPSSYIPPQALTDAERGAIYAEAGDMLKWAGYDGAPDAAAAGA